MRVSVSTGTRLHLGFTNLSGDLGRCFGSIGVALDRPSTTVVVEECDEFEVRGGDREQLRAYARRFAEHFGVEPRVSIDVRERIPEHVGLSSGTQLALGVGAGLAAICGIDADIREVARALGRGRRSGIGITAFQGGGLVIDAGARLQPAGGDAVPTVVWRRDFPAAWCFVVAIPGEGRGLSGQSEEGVFEALVPSVRISEEVCRLTQLVLMPALVEQDIEEFGRALTAIDRKTGAYFAGVQGGVYAGGETDETVDTMLRAGVAGAGQSSWGPAVYGLVHENAAGRVEAEVRAQLAAGGAGGRVFVAHGRNTRARVDVQKDAP